MTRETKEHKVVIFAKVEKFVKEKLIAMATEEDTTISNVVRKIIKKYFKVGGIK